MFKLIFVIGVFGAIGSVFPIVVAMVDPSAGFIPLIAAGIAGLTSSLLFIGLGKLGQVATDIADRLPKAAEGKSEEGLSMGSAIGIVALGLVIGSIAMGLRYSAYEKAASEAQQAASLAEAQRIIERYNR
ncbi:MAG: hypothetical protein KI792_12740 [Alphaproteobacteria bacterium]|nr:hypothetical protein [Alphaproteobacteria bacterium SS10]